ncbi:MAG: YkgJ family cysteine cluster protein [Caulobacteraceae bacterium]
MCVGLFVGALAACPSRTPVDQDASCSIFGEVSLFMEPSGTPTSSQANASENARRFACTSCGKCCGSGPEMELSEATALADKFITSLYIRIWTLPLSKGSKRANQGAQGQGSALTDEEALEENRRHLGYFSVRDKIDRSNGRSLHLTMSALTIDRKEGRCPALIDKRCGIYESRPLSCRTVPLHFSKSLSLLAPTLDSFVRMPGHLCDTSTDAPVVFDGERVTDPSIQQAREDALKLAESDRSWKNEILALMDDPNAAQAAGLPTYEAVVRNSDAGLGASVSMLVAWRVARNVGIISPRLYEEICEKQASLLKSELERVAKLDLAARLVGMLSEYESASAKHRQPLLSAPGPTGSE